MRNWKKPRLSLSPFLSLGDYHEYGTFCLIFSGFIESLVLEK